MFIFPPPQFYYFPSSMFLFPLPPQFNYFPSSILISLCPHNFIIFPLPPPPPHLFYIFFHPQIYRPYIGPTSTPHRPNIDPRLNLFSKQFHEYSETIYKMSASSQQQPCCSEKGSRSSSNTQRELIISSRNKYTWRSSLIYDTIYNHGQKS